MDNKEPDFLTLLRQSERQDAGGDISLADEFADIKPLRQDKVETKMQPMDEKLAKIRQQWAQKDKEQEALDEASCAFVHMVEPNEVLSFRRDGVQPYMLRKLKNGEYREADYIDLHGKTVEQAYDLVMRFIDHAKKEELRCILIIHGKGERAAQKDKRALLKSYVAHWLKQLPDVLAYHSAPEWKGGTGSVFVILKKGDKERAVNYERHAKRS